MEIRKAHDRREWAIELIEAIEEQAPHFTTRITRHQNPESAAASVRDFLGVSLDKQRAWRDQYEALRNWRRLIEKVGILTFQALGVEVDEARGFSTSDTPFPVAVANVKDAQRGRIFTLLHEVAHILLRGGGICDLHQSHDDENSHIEAFCNHVAGAVLFPRDELLATETVRRHQGGDRAWSDEELRDISRQFGGSREAALVRLLTLGLTNDAYYQQRRTEFLRQYAEWKRQQKGFPTPHVVAVSSAGEAFAGLVLENFNRERITASDVSDYLGIRAKHLPEIQRDYSNLAV